MEISRFIQPLHAPVQGIGGVVLSSGSLFAQGEFYDESVPASDGCSALQRVLPAVRVRETTIVPITVRGRDQARTWRDLYNNAEEDWFDRALHLAGLPQRDQIFGHLFTLVRTTKAHRNAWAITGRALEAGRQELHPLACAASMTYLLASGDHSSAKVSIWRRTSSVAVGWASGG